MLVGVVAKRTSAILLGLLPFGLMGCYVDHIDRKYTPQVESAAFRGPDSAWLVTWKGDLLSTNDGGDNWEQLPAQAARRFDKVTFIDERNGWVTTTDGKVLRTTDGGRTWASIAQLGDRRTGPGLGVIDFFDEKHGWIVHPLFFWRTEDGGSVWQQYPSPHAPPAAAFSSLFLTPQVGWLSGSGGAFSRTQDGGKTWEKTGGIGDRDLGEPCFVDSLVGWVAAGPNDGIYRTDDGGKTWSLLKDPGKRPYIYSVHFSSKTEGWAAWSDGTTGEPSKQEPRVLHTTNGGANWERVEVPEAKPFVHKVYFTDRAHGWLLSRDNVHRTDDGGKTWRIVLRLPPVAN